MKLWWWIKLSNHTCRTCGGKFDCGYGDPCSSKYEKIDCPLCMKDYIKMGRIDNLIDKKIREALKNETI